MPRERKKPLDVSQDHSQVSPNFIIDRIRMDKAVPLISGNLCDELAFGRDKSLKERYSERIAYELGRPDLSYMTQFRLVSEDIVDPLALRTDYINNVKNELFDLVEANANASTQGVLDDLDEEFDDVGFAEFATRLGHVHLAGPQQTDYQILANMPLSIYLTTSHFGSLVQALREAGKDPQIDFCRWKPELEDLEKWPSILQTDYKPSQTRPLVYHFYGTDIYPESLVLTEDDYMEFLVAIAQDEGRSGQNLDRIPAKIRLAISTASLMMLGYSMLDWDFRVIFRGLIKPNINPVNSQKGVCIQISPDEKEQQYLDKYLGREAQYLQLFWQETSDYLQQLATELEGA